MDTIIRIELVNDTEKVTNFLQELTPELKQKFLAFIDGIQFANELQQQTD